MMGMQSKCFSSSKVAIVVQGGLGDNIIYLARLRALLTKHQAHLADFYVIRQHIYQAVFPMIVELLESSELVDVLYYDELPQPEHYKAVLNWTIDNEPMNCPIEPYWKAPYTFDECKFATTLLEGVKKPITFYPYTMGSNPSNQHEKYMRSPKEEWWLGLFEAVKRAGGQPIVLGGPNEKINWGTTDVIEAYTSNWRYNIPLLYYISGHVGIASWPWQLTHYYNVVNTCVVWINNQFWIDRSVAEDQSKLHIYQEVPTYDKIISDLGVLKRE